MDKEAGVILNTINRYIDGLFNKGGSTPATPPTIVAIPNDQVGAYQPDHNIEEKIYGRIQQ